MTRRRWTLTACVSAALIATACGTTDPVPEFDEAPTVALLITPQPPPPLYGDIPADSGLRAMLVTTGTPLRSPYLRADRFEMRRLSDGARFAWRPIDPPQDAVAANPYFPGPAANYFLPRQQNADGLGSDSIAPGEAYELVAEVGRHRIVGRTRVPGRIEFVREAADGDTIVRWRRVPGAAAYAFGDIVFLRPFADTAVLIPHSQFGPLPEPVRITVFALDSNYAAFFDDFRVSHAGITGGWGVFGSYTWADTELPPPAASITPR